MKKDSEPLSRVAHEVILESISDGVFTVDCNRRITSFNRAAEEITGTRREDAIGRYCWEVFRSNMCESNCGLQRSMDEGKAFVSSSGYIINSSQQKVPVTVSTSPLRSENGRIMGGVETFRDYSQIEELKKELAGTCRLDDMVSRNAEMKKIFQLLPRVAESDSPVLISGETGTGKELLAVAIHNLSRRKGQPFVPVNCGAIVDNLLESELFGYKEGSFTGASRDKAGLFAAAGEGTIFLDEIGETSSAFQVSLLRVLQERKFQPIGSVQEIVTNARVITATNRDLINMVEEGEFRRDLFYRINVVSLHLPPLRERKEDIPLLLEKFIDKFNRVKERRISGVSQAVMTHLMVHDYPGNIRELENIIEHGFVLCREGEITPEHLPPYLLFSKGGIAGNVIDNRDGQACSVREVAEESEKEHILTVLKRNNYHRLVTAKELGIHKSTLFRKLKKYQIVLPDIDGRSSGKQLD